MPGPFDDLLGGDVPARGPFDDLAPPARQASKPARPLSAPQFDAALASIGLGDAVKAPGFDASTLLQPQIDAVDRYDATTGQTRPVVLPGSVPAAIAHRERLARDPVYNAAHAERMRTDYPSATETGLATAMPGRTGEQLLDDLGLLVRQGAREGVVALADAPRMGINALNTGVNTIAELNGVPADQRIPMQARWGIVDALAASADEIAATDRQLRGSAALAYDEANRPDGFGATVDYLIENPGAILNDGARSAGMMATSIVPGSPAAMILAQATQQGAMSAGDVEAQLIAAGIDPQTARAEAAKAFVVAQAIGTVAPRVVPGGDAFERLVTGGLGKRTAGGVAARVGAPLVGEPISEGGEEAGIRWNENIATGRPEGAGVGTAMATGMAIGAPMGAAPAAAELLRGDAGLGDAIDPALLARGNAALSRPVPPVPPAAPAPAVAPAPTPAPAKAKKGKAATVPAVPPVSQPTGTPETQAAQAVPPVPPVPVGLDAELDALLVRNVPGAQAPVQNAQRNITEIITGLGDAIAGPAQNPAPAGQPPAPVDGSDRAGGASWVIRNKETGEPVLETFDRAKVDALNTEKYEAVPAREHLEQLNDPTTRASAWARRDPSAESGASLGDAVPASSAPASGAAASAARPGRAPASRPVLENPPAASREGAAPSDPVASSSAPAGQSANAAPATGEPSVKAGKLYQRGNGKAKSSAQALQLPDGSWMVRGRSGGKWAEWEPRATFDPSPTFGYAETAMPGGAVNVPGVGRVPVKQSERAEKAKAQPNPLLDLIAAEGGVSRADAQRFGLDPKMANTRRGITPLFTKNGVPLDRLREVLVESGYFPEGALETITPDDVWQLVDRALNGETVGPLDDAAILEQMLKREAELYGDDYSDADAADVSDPFADFVDEVMGDEPLTPGDEAEIADLADLVERAIRAGMDDFDLAQSSNESDTAYAGRLQSFIDENRTDGPDTGATPPRGASDDQARAQGNPEADDLGAAAQVRESRDLFGTPSARERAEAARREKDAKRDGKAGTGRTDMAAGDGELFAGRRPAQAELDDGLVRGADGKPLTVYHGTRKQFDEFKVGFASGFGAGIYFTDNREYAASEYGGGAGGRVVAAHLVIRKPYRGQGLGLEVLEGTRAWRDTYSREWDDALDAWQEDGSFVGDVLRELGYDGVIAENSNDVQGTEYVVFDPSQVRQVGAPRVEAPVDLFTRTRGERQAQAAPAPAPAAKLRPDAKPAQTRQATNAIDALVERHGGSVLADRLARQFRLNDGAALVGQRIVDPRDLAALAEVYRNPMFETMRYVFVDKSGRVVHETAVSQRMPGSSAMFPKGRGANWLVSQARARGATGVWLMHNHPSGNPEPSSADRQVTAWLAQELKTRGTGLEMLGHVVLNHTRYAHIDAMGRDTLHTIPRAGADPFFADRGLVGLKADYYSLPRVAKQIHDAATSPDAVVLVSTNTKNEVNAATSFPPSVLGSRRAGALASALGKRSAAMSNFAIVTRAVATQHEPALIEALDSGLLTDVAIVDADGTVKSLANGTFRGGWFFDKVIGRNGRDENPRQVYEGAVEPDERVVEAWAEYDDTGEITIDELAGILELNDLPPAVERALDDYLTEAREDDAWGGRGDLADAGDRLADAVGAWIGGAAPVVREFAGERAETADRDSLERAKKLLADNRDPNAVRRETGWFRGPDGAWRFEISDDAAAWQGAKTLDDAGLQALARELAPQITEDAPDASGIYAARWDDGAGDWVRAFGRSASDAFANVVRAVAKRRGLITTGDFDIERVRVGEVQPLEKVLDHPQLFAAYPQLRRYAVAFETPLGYHGYFDESMLRIAVGIRADKDAMLSTLLHEIQHAIQHIEGFAEGGNTSERFIEAIRGGLKAATERARADLAEWVDGNRDAIVDAERAAEKYRHALKWESAQRLLDYADRDAPSGVFRLIRNEAQWLHEAEVREHPDARDATYLFYGIPKRGPKRNARIREIAHESARVILATIPADVKAEFKADTRKVRSMVDALARQRRRADAQLDGKRERERALQALTRAADGHQFSSGYDVYRHLAGEAEARNTQARQKLTADERRDRSPADTLDVDADRIIVSYGALEVHAPSRMWQVDEDALEDLLTAHGITPGNKLEAEAAWNRGDVIYAMHENAEAPHQVQTFEELRSYAEDQLSIVPRWLHEDALREAGLDDRREAGATPFGPSPRGAFRPLADLPTTRPDGSKRRGLVQMEKALALRLGRDLDPAEFAALVEFMDRFEAHLADVGVSFRANGGGARGRFSPDSGIVEIFAKAIEDGSVGRTMTHELWHALARHLTDAQVEAVKGAYRRAKAAWKKANPALAELMDAPRWTLAGPQAEAWLARHEAAAGDRIRVEREAGKPVVVRLARTDETYRFTSVDEFFAEEMTDRTQTQGEAAGILAAARSILADLWLMLRRIVGRGEVDKLFADYMGGKVDATRRRSSIAGGTDPLEVNYTPEQEAFLEKAGMPVDKRTVVQRVADDLRERWRAIVDFTESPDARRQALVDNFHGLRAAEARAGLTDPAQSAYIAARMTRGLASIMESVMLFGAPKWDAGTTAIDTGTVGLLDALKPVEGKVDAWLGWMVARRAQVLAAQGRENLMSAADIQAGLSLAGNDLPAFKQAAVEYLKIKNAVLDYAQEAGLIDPAARATWDHAEYIPFYRDTGTEAAGPGTRGGLANQSSGIRTLKGGEQNLADPLANIVRNFTSLIDAAGKNRAMLLAVDNLGSALFQKAPRQMQPATIPLDQVKKHLEAQGVPAATIAAMPQSALKGVQRMLSIVPPTGPDVVRVMRDGKAEYYTVLDPLVLRSLTAFALKNPGVGKRVLVWFKRLLTAGVTTSLDFVAANFLRDTGAAWVISDDRFTPGWDSLKGAINTLRTDAGTREMMMAGATFMGGQYYGGDPDAAAQAMRRALRAKGMSAGGVSSFMDTVVGPANPLRLWDGYLKLSSAIENANRRAVYDAAIKAGRPKIEAAYLARDLMDFSMRGDSEMMQFFADVLPFFNARVQGLYKLGRRAGTPEGKRALLLRGGIITLATAALYAWNVMAHGEEWDQLPEWEKDAYWHIGPGTDYHVRIPKPFEVGIAFATLPERALAAIHHAATGGEVGDRPATSIESLLRALGGTLAFNPIPQAALPIVESMTNMRFYQSRPIEGMADKGKLAADRAEWYTSDTAQAVSRAMPDPLALSPKRLEHLWTGYTGSLGAFVLDGADMVTRALQDAPERPERLLRDYPLVGRFVRGSAPATSKHVEEFYRLMEKAEQVEGSVKEHMLAGRHDEAAHLHSENYALLGDPIQSKRAKAGVLYTNVKALRSARAAMTAQRDAIEAAVLSRTMDPKAKREAVDAATRERNRIAREAVKATRRG